MMHEIVDQYKISKYKIYLCFVLSSIIFIFGEVAGHIISIEYTNNTLLMQKPIPCRLSD